MTRRFFFRNSALAMAGMRSAAHWPRSAASGGSGKRNVLVIIFQRGGADGLNIVVPFGDPNYYRIRPEIAVPRAAVIDLDGFFGLHPSLAPIRPIYAAGQLAIVHAVGPPHAIQTHTEAQARIDWITRTLARHNGELFPVRTVSQVSTTSGCGYPRGRLGAKLMQIAQLIRADAGVRFAFAESTGWDHHFNEAGKLPTEGQLAGALAEFGSALAAFRRDLGNLMENVTVVTLSEFGRSARANANRGTDHGHGNVMFVMGGGVRGGKVYGRWPGLGAAELHAGRDLAVTTDCRDVLSELLGGREKSLGLV